MSGLPDLAVLDVDGIEAAVALAEEELARATDRAGRALLTGYLADAYGALGHHDVAVRRAREAVALAPDDARALRRLGEAYRAAGRADEAALVLREAEGR